MLRRVLAIDDDELVLNAYRRGFGRGHEIETASTAVDGLALAATHRPDLVIVDLRIGADWGIDVIRQLRTLLPTSKIVLVSGFVSVASAVAAMKAGADHVLMKPASVFKILRELEMPTTSKSDRMPSLARAEWEHINRAVTEANGNITHAARALGIPRQSLQRRLKKLAPRS